MNGGLASQFRFLGSSTAEIGSFAANTGGWNKSDAYSAHSSYPWAMRGGQSPYGAYAGAFAFYYANGDVYHGFAHRTILSGY
jgi:hypothetical protein